MATRSVILSLLLSFGVVIVQVDGALPVTAVRLMYHGTDTTTEGLGRVEVLMGGVWGAVCDDLWDDGDATVVCRMVNRPTPPSNPAVRTTMFGETTSAYLLDDVDCSGSLAANNISACNAITTGITCNVFEPAGVMCVATNPFQPMCGPTLRLVRFPTVPEGMGLVEVRTSTIAPWGTVCDDLWDVTDADVVCKMCGFHTRFPGAYHPRPEAQGLVGNSTAGYLIDDVQCPSNATDLLTHCSYSTTHNCGPGEQASVTCIHLNNTGQEPPKPEVSCLNDRMTVGFTRSDHPGLTFSLLTVNPPTGCVMATDVSNSSHISVGIPMRQCNMNMTQNATHIVYNNTIGYASTSTSAGVSFANTYIINVWCALNRTANLTQDYTPQDGVVNASATGHYNVSMKFYLNDSFTVEATARPLPIPIGDNLNVAVELNGVYQDVMLVVANCWASPVHPATSSLWRDLMRDKCRTEPSLRIFPLNHTTFGFRFQTFKFVTSNTVYVSCDAYVCIFGLPYRECDQSCASNKPSAPWPVTVRRRRDTSSSIQYMEVTSPPLYVYAKPEDGVTSTPVTSTPRSTTTTTKEPDVAWEWAPVQPGPAGPQTGGATAPSKEEGVGGSAANQGDARPSPESQVLVMQPSDGASTATRPPAAAPLALLSLLLWAVIA